VHTAGGSAPGAGGSAPLFRGDPDHLDALDLDGMDEMDPLALGGLAEGLRQRKEQRKATLATLTLFILLVIDNLAFTRYSFVYSRRVH